MDQAHRREMTIAAAVAISAALAILSLKPFSWGSTICAVLFAVGAWLALANLMSLVRGDSPAVPIFKNEEMTKSRGGLGSLLSPLSFAGLVLLVWLAG